jgi:signal transduction histidine kinase
LHSLQTKLLLAFLGVALVAVGVLGILVGQAATGAFRSYLAGRENGGLAEMGRMMDERMGPAASQQMMERMVGPAEEAYLATISDALWLAGGLAALVAVALGLLLARRITRPLGDLSRAARQVAQGDYEQRVPVRSDDELGELAEAFNTMAEAVGRQEHLRRRMAADIAHELRNPLAIVQGDLEAMLDGVRPLSRGAVSSVHEETQLLSRLITDLRDLSLAEAGQLPLQRRPTDLGELARAAVGRLASRARDKEVELRAEAPEATQALPEVEVDPDRISQVLGNLLENALRHTPEGGRVMVSLEPEDGGEEVRVTVHDTGVGVPEDHLPNLFERFYRADQARSRSEGGSGIGLAVVKQIVEAHGGRVWVQSTPGEGASFGFTLPAAGAGLRADTPSQASEGWTRNGRA